MNTRMSTDKDKDKDKDKDRSPMIYLDNAATTPVFDEVLSEMVQYFKTHYGNPSSIHKFGRDAARAILNARKQVAALIGARFSEIIFTSGGTEADNLALKGVASKMLEKFPNRNQIITSNIEHEAVLEPCRALERKGFEIIFLHADKKAIVHPAELEKALSDRTALVSIMLANNEVGTIQPIEEMVKTVRKKVGHQVPFHTDAVQAAGKIPIDVNRLGVDLLSISSHKLNGPKGIGALYARDGTKLNPSIHGGGQERLLRSGTENVAGIVGFGKASEIAVTKIPEFQNRITELRDYMTNRILSEIPNSRLNGSCSQRSPANIHITFFGINGEDLILKLDENGIAASTGSACSVKKQKPSHVLKALGFSYEEITGSLRISLGIQTTQHEIDRALLILIDTIKQLRQLSPFKLKYGF